MLKQKGRYAIAPSDCPCVPELAPHARVLSDGRFIVSINADMPHNPTWTYYDHAGIMTVLSQEPQDYQEDMPNG